MPEKAVTSIVLTQLPKKLSYLTGSDRIDPGGGQLCALYDDGSFDTISMTNPEVTFSFSFTSEGPSLVTVKYKEQIQMFQVFVRNPVIRKFHLGKVPDKRVYIAGEKVDLTGLELIAEYETGEKAPYTDIPDVDYSVKRGDAVYPLNINGITVPIYIRVQDSTLTGIRMGNLPNKTNYLEKKDKFDPTGGTIIQVYDSGVEEETPLPFSAVSGFSNLSPGPLTLTVRIGNALTTFDVRIVEKQAIRLSVDTPPFRTSFTEGEQIDLGGIRILAEYDNGENHICEDWDYEPKVARLDDTIVHIKTNAASAQLPITVMPRQLIAIQVHKKPNKLRYRENCDPFDATGAELKLEYDYGEPLLIPVTNDMVKGFDNRRAGECRVEVQYQSLADSFMVDIIPQTLLGITISQMPNKTDYAPGDMFDKEGLVVLGFYDSGQLLPLRSFLIEPDRPLQESDIAVLITSMDKTAVIPIKVGEMFRPKPELPLEWTFPEDGAWDLQSDTETRPETSVPDTASGFLPNDQAFPGTQTDSVPEAPKRRLWSGKLFYPSFSKHREE